MMVILFQIVVVVNWPLVKMNEIQKKVNVKVNEVVFVSPNETEEHK